MAWSKQCCILLLSTYVVSTLTFTVVVGPGRRECFYRDFKNGTVLESEIGVIKGGELDIRFELRDPLGILVTSGISKPSNKETDREVKEEAKEKDSEERREEEGERDIRTHWSYSLKIKKEGRYSLCLDNSYSVMTEKLVTFEFDSDDDESLDTFSDSIDSLLKQFEENTTQAVNPHLKDMQKVGIRLTKTIIKIMAYQKSHRLRERRHRYLADENLFRVTWFSLFSCLIMVGVGVMQVFIVKNLFEENTRKKFIFW